MQEEIENRTVTLIISAVKLTARELKAGMDKYLSEKKSKAMEKARAAPEKPSGKQTVRQLIGQNQGVSNIEITNSNTNDEMNLMCIYQSDSRSGLIAALTEMRGYLDEDEAELRALTDSSLQKLSEITDEDYAALELVPDFDTDE